MHGRLPPFCSKSQETISKHVEWPKRRGKPTLNGQALELELGLEEDQINFMLCKASFVEADLCLFSVLCVWLTRRWRKFWEQCALLGNLPSCLQIQWKVDKYTIFNSIYSTENASHSLLQLSALRQSPMHFCFERSSEYLCAKKLVARESWMKRKERKGHEF